MITKVNVIRGETITKVMNARQAQDCSNAAAKAIYGRLFKWIVYGNFDAPSGPSLPPPAAASSFFSPFGMRGHISATMYLLHADPRMPCDRHAFKALLSGRV